VPNRLGHGQPLRYRYGHKVGAQIEALNRYRSHSEPAVTVQNVSVADGGNAIVGNVTLHRNVIVSDRKARKAAGARRRRADGQPERA
jgi:hypothetical protein